MGQKKSFTMTTEAILNRGQSPDVGAGGGSPQGKPQESRPVGRPRIHNHPISTTSQSGLREGLTRMTFIVDEVKQDKLKYISYFERLSIRQILDEAIDDYIAKYESQAGPINLNQ